MLIEIILLIVHNNFFFEIKDRLVTDEVMGIEVKFKNIQVVEEIFNHSPNILSNLKIGLPNLKSEMLNTLAELYTISKKEILSDQNIEYILMGLKDMNVLGVNIEGLKANVKEKIQAYLGEEEENVKELQAKLNAAEGVVEKLRLHLQNLDI